jgi:hypothetical protein
MDQTANTRARDAAMKQIAQQGFMTTHRAHETALPQPEADQIQSNNLGDHHMAADHPNGHGEDKLVGQPTPSARARARSNARMVTPQKATPKVASTSSKRRRTSDDYTNLLERADALEYENQQLKSQLQLALTAVNALSAMRRL